MKWARISVDSLVDDKWINIVKNHTNLMSARKAVKAEIVRKLGGKNAGIEVKYDNGVKDGKSTVFTATCTVGKLRFTMRIRNQIVENGK